MGFIVKLDETQKDRLALYLNNLIELYKEGSFFMIPIGNGGYCIAFNPFHEYAYSRLMMMLGDDVMEYLIFLLKDPELINKFGNLNEKANKLIKRYFPGNIIISISKKEENPSFGSNMQIPNEIWEKFPNMKITVVSNGFLENEIFQFLEESGFPPFLICLYPFNGSDLDVHNPIELFQCLGLHEIAMGFDIGQVQEGNKKNLKLLTVVQVSDNGDVEFLNQGIIDPETIREYLSEK